MLELQLVLCALLAIIVLVGCKLFSVLWVISVLKVLHLIGFHVQMEPMEIAKVLAIVLSAQLVMVDITAMGKHRFNKVVCVLLVIIVLVALMLANLLSTIPILVMVICVLLDITAQKVHPYHFLAYLVVTMTLKVKKPALHVFLDITVLPKAAFLLNVLQVTTAQKEPLPTYPIHVHLELTITTQEPLILTIVLHVHLVNFVQHLVSFCQ
jgi:hypothetical protein